MAKMSRKELSGATWLTPRELEQYIGMPRSTQSKYRMNSTNKSLDRYRSIKKNPIPFYKIGSTILYKREEIDNWIENYQNV